MMHYAYINVYFQQEETKNKHIKVLWSTMPILIFIFKHPEFVFKSIHINYIVILLTKLIMRDIFTSSKL